MVRRMLAKNQVTILSSGMRRIIDEVTLQNTSIRLATVLFGKKGRRSKRLPSLKISRTPHARTCFNVDGLQNSQRTGAIALSAKRLSFPVEWPAFGSRKGKAFPTRHYGFYDTRLLTSPSRIGRSFLGINTLERNKRISFSQYQV